MISLANRKYLLIIGAIIGWFAVTAQLYLILFNRVASIEETIVRFFSFFTVLTNLLVAIYFTVSWLTPNSGLGHFFARPGVFTATAVYIVIVGLVYQLILRGIWHPTGLQRLVDELLHSVMPLYFLIYWFTGLAPKTVHWRQQFSWLIYPLVYLIFILLRGAVANYYPYPFVDVMQLGYNQVLMNCTVLLLVFSGISALMIWINRIK
jgi:hypothetical protein